MLPGQIVYSRSGRDAGRAFVVVAIEDENYIFIADGDIRRFENAKKKKKKHIIETEFVDKLISEKLINFGRVSNAELRRAVKSYVCNDAEEV